MKKFKYFETSEELEAWQEENPQVTILDIQGVNHFAFVVYTEEKTTKKAKK